MCIIPHRKNYILILVLFSLLVILNSYYEQPNHSVVHEQNSSSTIKKSAFSSAIHPLADTFNKMLDNSVAIARFNSKEYGETYKKLSEKKSELNPEEMRIMGFLLLHGYGVKEGFC